MIRSAIALLLVMLLSGCATAAQQTMGGHIHPEKHYQERWCNEHHGVMEHRLADRARVDCLTDEYAIEFDFGPKWAESIGQALYYSEMTGKRPGVVLIMEHGDGDQRYRDRLQRVSDRYGITMWTMGPDD